MQSGIRQSVRSRANRDTALLRRLETGIYVRSSTCRYILLALRFPYEDVENLSLSLFLSFSLTQPRTLSLSLSPFFSPFLNPVLESSHLRCGFSRSLQRETARNRGARIELFRGR